MDFIDQINAAPRKGLRKLVALAGPPASGKSTLAENIAQRLNARVVPMDGFHLDNAILAKRGLVDRKGAPETIDVAGFVHMVRRLRDEQDVIYPLFDRTRDLAIAGAGHIDATCRTVVIEGNYLLHDAEIWRDLHGLWDFSIRLQVSESILRDRLIARWTDHGLSADEAAVRADGNDLRNARTMASAHLSADLTIESK